MNPSSCRRFRVRVAHWRPPADLVRVRGRGALRLTVVTQLPPCIPQAQQGHQVGRKIGFATPMHPNLEGSVDFIQYFDGTLVKSGYPEGLYMT